MEFKNFRFVLEVSFRKLHVCNEKPAHGSMCLNGRRRIEKTTNHMFDLPCRESLHQSGNI
jgi:hypothetical protein